MRPYALKVQATISPTTVQRKISLPRQTALPFQTVAQNNSRHGLLKQQPVRKATSLSKMRAPKQSAKRKIPDGREPSIYSIGFFQSLKEKRKNL
ncbi:MAG: hypothetical protein ACI9S8_001612 [Chlamydiales bacterium]|jgi:hypothetical protein